jgi:anti-sigma-K factor RskA
VSKRLESMDQLAVEQEAARQRAPIVRWRLACLALAILAVGAIAWAAVPRYAIAADGPWVFILNTATGKVERIPAVEVPQRKP